MFIAVRHFIVGICLMCCVASASASPVGYAFSGTLSQPYDGSTQFSGSFYYDTSLVSIGVLTPPPTLGSIEYQGEPTRDGGVNVSFNLPGNLGSAWLSPNGEYTYPYVVVTHTQSNDSFAVNQTFDGQPGQGLLAVVTLGNNNVTQPGPFSSTSLPSSLNLGDFNLGAQFFLYGTTSPSGPYINISGTITSLTGDGDPAAVPEPSSVLVFLVLGTGLALRLSKRRESAKPLASGALGSCEAIHTRW
jgi:hypothetical protein